MKDLYISEHFGPTYQGEGEFLGERVAFLRLAGCNLTCVWCDTKYTWNFTRGAGAVRDDSPSYDQREQVHRMTVGEVISVLDKYDVDRFVISGGEPMLQQEALLPVVNHLLNRLKAISIETNGTVLPEWFQPFDKVDFTVSPKLSNADLLKQRSVSIEDWMDYNPVFKFVCSSEDDLDEVASFNIPKHRVWIMPEGTDAPTILAHTRILAQPTLDRGWNLTTRLHTLIWGDERAR